MNGWNFVWIALGYLLAALVGAVVGAVGGGMILLKALFKMHENSLPPKERHDPAPNSTRRSRH